MQLQLSSCQCKLHLLNSAAKTQWNVLSSSRLTMDAIRILRGALDSVKLIRASNSDDEGLNSILASMSSAMLDIPAQHAASARCVT